MLVNAATLADPKASAELLTAPLLEALERELHSVGTSQPSKV